MWSWGRLGLFYLFILFNGTSPVKVEIEVVAAAARHNGGEREPLHADVVDEAGAEVEAGDQVVAAVADVDAVVPRAPRVPRTSVAPCTSETRFPGPSTRTKWRVDRLSRAQLCSDTGMLVRSLQILRASQERSWRESTSAGCSSVDHARGIRDCMVTCRPDRTSTARLTEQIHLSSLSRALDLRRS